MLESFLDIVNSACWLVEFRFNINIKGTGMSVGKVNLGL